MTNEQAQAVKALEDEATLLRACREDLPEDDYLTWCRSWLDRYDPLGRSVIAAPGFGYEDMHVLGALVLWGPSIEEACRADSRSTTRVRRIR